MTKEEAKLVLDNARPQTKEIDRQFYDDEDLNNALDMAIKALEQQLINQVNEQSNKKIINWLDNFFKMEFPKTFDEFANDYGFTDDKEIYTNGSHLIPVFRVKQWLDHIEQQPSDDIMAIHTQGLDEGIRCAVCTNSMKSDSGCDGGCRVDEDMYKKVMETINNQMFSRPTADDCVSRKQAKADVIPNSLYTSEQVIALLDNLSPVTPERKSGLHWIERFNNEDKWLECPYCHKDSDNAYKYCPNCGSLMRGAEND